MIVNVYFSFYCLEQIVNFECYGRNVFPKSWHSFQKKLRNAHQTSAWNTPQANWERAGCHEWLEKLARRASALCGQPCEKTIEQFQDDVPPPNVQLQCMGSIISSKVSQNPEKITAGKRQGRKPTLNDRDLWSRGCHCVKKNPNNNV